MSYIGSTPTSQNFISGTDYFNGTGSQTAFTLTRTVNSVNDIEVVVNNVVQQPSGYTVSGTTLTLSAAPSSGTNNVYARYLSTTTQTIAPSQGTVTTPTIADAAVTQAKLATGVAGTGPAFSAYMSSSLSITNATFTKVPADTEEFDTNSCYDTANYRFTPNIAGYYQVVGAVNIGAPSSGVTNAYIYKNGSNFKSGNQIPFTATANYIVPTVCALIYLNGSTDYVELYTYQSSGSTQTINASAPVVGYFQASLVRSA